MTPGGSLVGRRAVWGVGPAAAGVRTGVSPDRPARSCQALPAPLPFVGLSPTPGAYGCYLAAVTSRGLHRRGLVRRRTPRVPPPTSRRFTRSPVEEVQHVPIPPVALGTAACAPGPVSMNAGRAASDIATGAEPVQCAGSCLAGLRGSLSPTSSAVRGGPFRGRGAGTLVDHPCCGAFPRPIPLFGGCAI